MNETLLFVDEAVPGIRWDAKYATWDNFTGTPVDGYEANRIVGTRQLCTALAEAKHAAAERGFGLVLWDGYRPQRAVDRFVRWFNEPEDERTKLRHYPNIRRSEMADLGYVATQSGHTRGSAIDLTLFNLESGDLTPMGGRHDLMDPISHHDAEGITQTDATYRRQLRAVMEDSGFSAYASEWWHYSLNDEPYPNTYFDVPITSERPRALRSYLAPI